MAKITKILFKDRLEKYLSVFNEWKLKWTGVNSRYTTNNQTILSAWNNAVVGMSDEDLNTLAISIKKAMYSACESDWHKTTKYKWITPQFFLREDKREFWLTEYQVNYNVKKQKPFKPNRYV